MFVCSPKKNPTSFNQSLQKITLLKDVVVSCTTTSEHLLLATPNGVVYLLNENYTLHKKFQAYQTRIDLVAVNKEENILVTVGNDEDTVSPRVKWWDLGVWDHEGFPILFNEVTLETQMLVIFFFFDSHFYLFAFLLHFFLFLLRFFVLSFCPYFFKASTLAVSSDLQTSLIGLHDGNNSFFLHIFPLSLLFFPFFFLSFFSLPSSDFSSHFLFFRSFSAIFSSFPFIAPSLFFPCFFSDL